MILVPDIASWVMKINAAWTKEGEMTLDALLPIYKKIDKEFSSYYKEFYFINLDVIPGTKALQKDGAITKEMINQALIKSDENFKILTRELGSRILPVFHQGESWNRYEECQEMSSYVCISPSQAYSENVRVNWLQQVATKTPVNIKLHGLATTGKRSIATCPWFSVDSASWVITGGLGKILIPRNEWIQPVQVSEESLLIKDIDCHIDNMSPQHVEHIRNVVESFGFKLEELRMNPRHRKAFNLLSTQEQAKKIKFIPHQQETLF